MECFVAHIFLWCFEKIIYIYLIWELKGTGSRDRFFKIRRKWTNLELKKEIGRFLSFQRLPQFFFNKKISYSLCLSAFFAIITNHIRSSIKGHSHRNQRHVAMTNKKETTVGKLCLSAKGCMCQYPKIPHGYVHCTVLCVRGELFISIRSHTVFSTHRCPHT